MTTVTQIDVGIDVSKNTLDVAETMPRSGVHVLRDVCQDRPTWQD
jgi:hypothetical protein